VVDRGTVIAEGTRAEFKASVGAGRFEVRLGDPAQRWEAARVLAAALRAEPAPYADPTSLTVQMPQTDGGAVTAATRAIALLEEAGIAVSDFGYAQPSLDEVFLSLTGHHPATHDEHEEGVVQ